MLFQNTARERWTSFLSAEKGAATIEYALIAAGMGSAFITAFSLLNGGSGFLFFLSDLLDQSPPPLPRPDPKE